MALRVAAVEKLCLAAGVATDSALLHYARAFWLFGKQCTLLEQVLVSVEVDLLVWHLGLRPWVAQT